jgi:TM2 domain-containing membrane protein YozV
MEFSCPHCLHVLRTPDAKAGLSARCPACGESLWVPHPHELAASSAEDAPTNSSHDESRRRQQAGAAVDEVEFLDSSEEAPRMADVNMKHCVECGQQIRAKAEICPHCGVRQPMFSSPAGGFDPMRSLAQNKLAAGLCGILIGGFGIHKFILGLNTPGIIMLVITAIVSPLTCGWGYIPMAIIGAIEGIIYLTKSDEQFYQDYVVEKRGWF